MHTCMHKLNKIFLYFSIGVFTFKDSILFMMSVNYHKMASDSKLLFLLVLRSMRILRELFCLDPREFVERHIVKYDIWLNKTTGRM